MGVYINMEKPKDCSECILADKHLNGLYEAKYYCRLEADSCPLIEVVTCGECKHCEKRETAKHILINYCEAHGITVLKTDYCNWGERRADNERL